MTINPQYVAEHRSQIAARLLRSIRVDKKTRCWLWQRGLINGGYGGISIQDSWELAHRASYILFRGPISKKLTLDHLCNNQRCVNPWHLKQTTMRANIMRGNGVCAVNARKTHCKNGHGFTTGNTYRIGRFRYCRKCITAAQLRYQKRKRNNHK